MHSPWWIAGPVEQRFTGCEFDEARSRGMGDGLRRSVTFLTGGIFLGRRKEASLFSRRGDTLFSGGRKHSSLVEKEAFPDPDPSLGRGTNPVRPRRRSTRSFGTASECVSTGQVR